MASSGRRSIACSRTFRAAIRFERRRPDTECRFSDGSGCPCPAVASSWAPSPACSHRSGPSPGTCERWGTSCNQWRERRDKGSWLAPDDGMRSATPARLLDLVKPHLKGIPACRDLAGRQARGRAGIGARCHLRPARGHGELKVGVQGCCVTHSTTVAHVPGSVIDGHVRT
jgi:hypothetical protein